MEAAGATANFDGNEDFRDRRDLVLLRLGLRGGVARPLTTGVRDRAVGTLMGREIGYESSAL